ncbi:phytanoyl-CoA dioxygenase family protein [Xylanibacillus composti]|uniref:Protein involved in biosynthesis of mitomycin antibiotics/polyketide fumonisin n=1 Tax=Xylanibacillus composti TaxID=1572762 RepID=A0A8J4M264_9BACL|nr:phytanoyl-CoA dioxygenase family protein [Xylanibacillus composti]MDT9726704.1 phytanoyl-CoA dioxygenase family protein [Xylanibacillus composti]GIQ69364.1 protein involved in biosynthesis of mitomycin antibiotics/polyketide fumonisin [Xylanibacillus composti]
MPDTPIAFQDRQQFDEQGYLIVKGVYSKRELDELHQEYVKIWTELMALGKIRQNRERPLESLFPNRLRDFHRDNPVITAFMLKQEAIAILESLLGEEPLAIQSNYYFKPPGTKGLGFHQDNAHIGIEPDTSYAMWVSIDATDGENGSLFFVPGTHKLGLAPSEVVPGSSNAYSSEILRKPDGYQRIQVETEPGDVVLFNGNMYHGSSKNVSSYRYRRSFVTHFARASVERIALNYSHLVSKHGQRVRRRLNSRPKIIDESSIFQYRDAAFYDQIIHGIF